MDLHARAVLQSYRRAPRTVADAAAGFQRPVLAFFCSTWARRIKYFEKFLVQAAPVQILILGRFWSGIFLIVARNAKKYIWFSKLFGLKSGK